LGAGGSPQRPMQPEIHLGGITLQTFGICFALAFVAAGLVVARTAARARQAARLGLRDLPGRDRRRCRRSAALLRRRQLLRRQERPAWKPVLGLRAGLVRRGHRRGDRRRNLGLAPGHVRRDPARPLRGAAPPSATPSAASAANSQATATTASRGTARGRCRIQTAPSRPTKTVHPTPIYETLAMGLLAYLLWRLRDRYRPGILSRSTCSSRDSSGSS